MKRLLILTALLPFVGFAQPINTLNNPNQPGYQIPSQQRMQTQMQTQQIQQKGDAPRDKCTLSCAINGIHAAFHYLKKNYISGCVMTVPTGW